MPKTILQTFPDLESVETQLAKESLHAFVRQAWRTVEPKDFADGWHLQAICEHLEAVNKGQIKNLVINIPPRHTKSITVSVMWPAWTWIKDPSVRWMFASYAQHLSIRDSVKCRRVIESSWYQNRWATSYGLMGDQNAKQRYDNSKGGYRLATSVDGVGTGEGGDLIVCVVAGTLITTDQGQIPIEHIVEEQLRVRVLGSSGYNRILKYEKNHSTKRLVQIGTKHSKLTCTEDHPIWVNTVESGYFPAGSLVGLPEGAVHIELLVDGIPTPSKFTATYLDEVVATVYNLQVEYDHNYYANNILTHNCDDPHSVTEVESEIQRVKVTDWWDAAMSSRGNDPKKSHRVIIMQRTHHSDLTGHVKERMGDDYEFLVLPAEFDPRSICQTSIGFTDPRKDDGELLWPDRFGTKEIAEKKRDLESHHFAAQYNQQPSLAEGSIFKRAWFRFYSQPPAELAQEMEFLCQSWDMTFKDTDGTDYVCGQVWGFKGADRYLFDQVCERMSFTQTLHAVEVVTKKWPDALAKYVEEKANGAAVIDSLRHRIGGLVAINPHESKQARAYAVTPVYESGNVYYPDPKHAPWIDEHMEMMGAFPKGKRDDDVDAETQAQKQMSKRIDRLGELTAPLVEHDGRSGWSSMSAVRR